MSIVIIVCWSKLKADAIAIIDNMVWTSDESRWTFALLRQVNTWRKIVSALAYRLHVPTNWKLYAGWKLEINKRFAGMVTILSQVQTTLKTYLVFIEQSVPQLKFVYSCVTLFNFTS